MYAFIPCSSFTICPLVSVYLKTGFSLIVQGHVWVTQFWKQGKQKRTVALITHLVTAGGNQCIRALPPVVLGHTGHDHRGGSRTVQPRVWQYWVPIHQWLEEQRILWEENSSRDFPGGSVVRNPPANAGDTGSSPGLGRSHMPQSN